MLELAVACRCALIKTALQTINHVTECMLHVDTNVLCAVMSELLSQLSSVRSRAVGGGPHSLSSHFSQLEMQLSSSRFVSTLALLIKVIYISIQYSCSLSIYMFGKKIFCCGHHYSLLGLTLLSK